MNVKVNFTLLIVYSFATTGIVAQAVPQDKVYIYDSTYVLSSIQDNFAYILINEINAYIDKEDINTRFLNINVSKRLKNKISYCLINAYFFSAIVPNHHNQMGINSSFVAWSLEELKLNNPKYINDFIKENEGGDVSFSEMLMIDNSVIRTAIYENIDNPITIDLESNGIDNLYLAIINEKKTTVSLYSMALEDSQLLFSKKSKGNLPVFSQILTASDYTGKVCNLAYLKGKIFIIDEHQNVFRVDDKKLTCIFQHKENPLKSIDDSMIIIDKDNQALYLSSKELLKNYEGTMKEFLKLCTSVTID